LRTKAYSDVSDGDIPHGAGLHSVSFALNAALRARSSDLPVLHLDSFHSSDDSFLEDLLANLHEFPRVPEKIPLHTVMLTPIAQQDGHHISGRNSPSHPSLVIDTTPGTVLKELPSEEGGDAAKDFLDASRILRGYVHHQSSRRFGT
jgi:hypothetical protein